MYLPDIPKVLSGRSIVYLDKSRFTLDASGVAGFFGGAEAASAMATVHICRNRKRWGWYNSPGSYEIAKHYGLLTKFGFFFGGGHADPAELLTLFELDGRKGPLFLRIHSGAIIPETDHLAAVFMENCTSLPYLVTAPDVPGGRQPVYVTIAEFHKSPKNNKVLRPIHTRWDSPILAAIPIIVSTGTSVMCAVVTDWYSCSLILLGVIANGVSCFVIGSVELKFMRPKLAGESDGVEVKPNRISGILITATDIVLLKGREDAAMALAGGKFVLTSPSDGKPFREHKRIGWCSILLLVQFIAQLLLIPQGTLFGQIMFVFSLGVSWCYNLWLCSIDKAWIQQQILLGDILSLKQDDMQKYKLHSWPAMVAFVLLTLVHEDDEILRKDEEPEERELRLHKVLDVLVDDTSKVWGIWRLVFLAKLQKLKDSDSPASKLDLDMVKDMEVPVGATDKLSSGDLLKLNALLDETRSGIEMFRKRHPIS